MENKKHSMEKGVLSDYKNDNSISEYEFAIYSNAIDTAQSEREISRIMLAAAGTVVWNDPIPYAYLARYEASLVENARSQKSTLSHKLKALPFVLDAYDAFGFTYYRMKPNEPFTDSDVNRIAKRKGIRSTLRPLYEYQGAPEELRLIYKGKEQRWR